MTDSLFDEIRKRLKGERKSEFIDQLLKEKELYDALRQAGLTVQAEDVRERARQRPMGILSLVEKINLVDLITEITTIKTLQVLAEVTNIKNLESLDLIDRISLIDKITNVDTLANITNIQNLESVDLIDTITNIGTLDQLNTIGTIQKINPSETENVRIDRILNIDNLGTLNQLNTVNNIQNLGTLDQLNTVGQINKINPQGSDNVVIDKITNIDTLANITNIQTLSEVTNIKNVESLDLIDLIEQINQINTIQNIANIEKIENLPNVLVVGSKNVPLKQLPVTSPSWISPTGYEDSTDWQNPAYAYDGNTSTFASYNASPKGSTTFLVLTFSQVSSNSVKFYVSDNLGNSSILVDVDVYDGSQWIDVFYGYVETGTWIIKTFSQRTISKVRLKLYNPSLSEDNLLCVHEVMVLQIPENESSIGVVNYGREDLDVKEFNNSFSDAGDFEVLSAVGNQKHKIYSYGFEIDADVEVGFRFGTGNKWGRRITKGVMMQTLLHPIVGSVNTPLNFRAEGAVSVKGWVQYITEA